MIEVIYIITLSLLILVIIMANILAFVIVASLLLMVYVVAKLARIRDDININTRQETKRKLRRVCVQALWIVGGIGVVIAVWLMLFY